MAKNTLDLIRRAFEARSRTTCTLEMDDGTAEIAVHIRGPVTYGLHTAFFRVMQDTGDLHVIESCVYLAHCVEEPDLPLYEALNAVNFELLTESGVRVYLDLFEADIMLVCQIPPLVSDEDVGRICLSVLFDLEMALAVCSRFPALFACSDETDPLGTGEDELEEVRSFASPEPPAERRRQPRRYFRERGRCSAFREAAYRQRVLEFMIRILQLPRIDYQKDDAQ